MWRNVGSFLAFFEDHAEWRGFAPFGKIGIILDPTGPNLADAEEYLNLMARRQIPYRVIDRPQLGAHTARQACGRCSPSTSLRPPKRSERPCRDFAAAEAWFWAVRRGAARRRTKSYTVVGPARAKWRFTRRTTPDPQSVGRDLNDLLNTEELGVSVFNAPSVLSYVSMGDSGKRMLIQLVNYAGAPGRDDDHLGERKIQHGATVYPGKRAGGSDPEAQRQPD